MNKIPNPAEELEELRERMNVQDQTIQRLEDEISNMKHELDRLISMIHMLR